MASDILFPNPARKRRLSHLGEDSDIPLNDRPINDDRPLDDRSGLTTFGTVSGITLPLMSESLAFLK